MDVRMILKSALLIFGSSTLIAGCTSDEGTADRAPIHFETQSQAIGEASQAVTFSGIGAGEMPTYDERVAIHLMNRVHTAPYMWNIMIDTDGDMMPDAPAPPQPAMRYQHFFSEAGRWQGDHSIENQCFCPQNMNDPDEYNASCCEVGLVNGEVACIGPRVECGDMERRTTRRERWEVLNIGPGEIQTELYWNGDLESPGTVPGEVGAAFMLANATGTLIAERQNAVGIAQVNTPIVPEECRPPMDTCEEGTCTDTESGANTCDPETNEDCLGLCQGEGVDPTSPTPCTLPEEPDAETCNPDNWGNAFYYSFVFGRSSEPTPVLTDGIAVQLGASANMMNPNGFFGLTPDGETEFTIHYFEPAGPPQEIQTVVDGNCLTMDFWQVPPNVGGTPTPPDPDMGDDMGNDMGMAEEAPYAGITYSAFSQLSPGCHRFAFAVTDGEGFISRYPTLGSLGALVNGEGAVVPNDDTCPAWAADNLDTACLAVGDQCNNGDTRPCYTGRDGTQDFGICNIGTETCERGRWNGFCEGETRPDAEETCQDEIDNNCNGSVDEGCPFIVDPNNGNNNGNNNNTNNGDTDMGDIDMGGSNPGGDKGDDDEGCGCSTLDGRQKSTPWGAIAGLMLLGFALIRRRA